MSTYVEVPRKALEDALQSWGFTREPVRGEITYVRKHHVDPKFCVRVYTSVPEFNDTARERGEDAIRVVSTLQWTRKNEDVPRRKVLYRARVFRVTSVEGVISRLHDKAREAYIAINSHRAKGFVLQPQVSPDSGIPSGSLGATAGARGRRSSSAEKGP